MSPPPLTLFSTAPLWQLHSLTVICENLPFRTRWLPLHHVKSKSSPCWICMLDRLWPLRPRLPLCTHPTRVAHCEHCPSRGFSLAISSVCKAPPSLALALPSHLPLRKLPPRPKKSLTPSSPQSLPSPHFPLLPTCHMTSHP